MQALTSIPLPEAPALRFAAESPAHQSLHAASPRVPLTAADPAAMTALKTAMRRLHPRRRCFAGRSRAAAGCAPAP